MGRKRLFQNSKEERGREDVGKINVGTKVSSIWRPI